MRNSKEIENICKLALAEYLNTAETERSLTKLGDKYNIRRQTLSSYFKKWGYEIINQQNRCRLNKHVFDNINTEAQYYWLGFLYADGNISSKGNRLEVRLSINDLDHLEKFRSFLKLSTPIRTGICNEHGFCHLSVRNKHIWNILNSYGCTPAKSLTLSMPPKEFFGNVANFLHFIRGYIDGDGCLCVYKDNNKVRTRLSLVGTENFLMAINHVFKGIGCLRSKSSVNYENKAFELKFSDVPSRKIARMLYANATIYLDRKYEKYKQFCLIEEQSSKRQSSKLGEFVQEIPR